MITCMWKISPGVWRIAFSNETLRLGVSYVSRSRFHSASEASLLAASNLEKLFESTSSPR